MIVKKFRYLLAIMLFLSTSLMCQTYTLSYLFDYDADSLRIATDEHSHAIAAFTAVPSNRVYTAYYSNNRWNTLPIPNDPDGTVEGLVMHSDGTALLTYIEDGSNDLRSLYFNGSAWTIPSLDPIATNVVDGGALAMNAIGHAAVAWSDSSSEVLVNIFQNGAWGTASNPGDIGVGTGSLVGINGDDDLVVGFNDGTDVYVNISIGGIWNPNLPVNTDAALAGVGMDDSGNSIAVVRDNIAGDIIAYNFTGGSLSTTTTLNAGSPDPQYTGLPVLEVTPTTGTAVVAWNYADSTTPLYGLYYNQFFAGGWDVAVELQSGTEPLTNLAISMNTDGDTLFFYGNQDTWVLTTSILPEGGPMDPSIEVPLAEGLPSNLVVSFADNHFNALGWIEDGVLPIGMGVYLLPAPIGLQVRACYDRDSNTAMGCINYLNWNYSDNVAIASYNIYKDGVFLENVPVNDPQTYTDAGGSTCGETVVYAVEAVDLDGVPGIQANVTLN